MANVKEELHKLADRLPDDATWDDVVYRLYRRRELEAGHRDLEEGRVHAHEDVKKRFLGA
jgi:predicted transcriptional regulator